MGRILREVEQKPVFISFYLKAGSWNQNILSKRARSLLPLLNLFI